jgi:xylulokinase
MPEYILAHDVGTSRNKAVLVDAEGRVHGKCSGSYGISYPRPDWAEQDPNDWWAAVTHTTRSLLEQTGVSPADVMCVTYSTQMLGIVPLDSMSEPLRPAIIWLDNRACSQATSLMRKFLGPRVFTYFAGVALCGKDGMPKLLWLKSEEPDVYQRMHCFLDVAGYLIYRSTGNKVMEWTGASVFGLDLKKKTWMSGVPGRGANARSSRRVRASGRHAGHSRCRRCAVRGCRVRSGLRRGGARLSRHVGMGRGGHEAHAEGQVRSGVHTLG